MALVWFAKLSQVKVSVCYEMLSVNPVGQKRGLHMRFLLNAQVTKYRTGPKH